MFLEHNSFIVKHTRGAAFSSLGKTNTNGPGGYHFTMVFNFSHTFTIARVSSSQ